MVHELSGLIYLFMHPVYKTITFIHIGIEKVFLNTQFLIYLVPHKILASDLLSNKVENEKIKPSPSSERKMNMSSHRPPFAARFVSGLVFTGGALLLLFWVLYLCGVITPGEEDQTMASAFESAFPLADSLLGLSLMITGIGLIKRRSFGTFFLVTAGAMTLYLGILDVTFYVQQGLYFPLTFSNLFLLCVNVFCILGGGIGLWFGWKFWRTNDAILKLSARSSDRRNGQRQRHWRRDRPLVGASRS